MQGPHPSSRARWILAQARLPIIAVVATGLIAFGVASILPRWYRAETTLLPPDESGSSIGGLSSLIEASALSRIGLITSTSTADLFAEVLRSRRVREPLIERFDLKSRYREPNLDLCLREFDRHVNVDVLLSDVLILRVEDRDPKIASQIANEMIEALDRVYLETRVQKAVRAREFLEGQLASSQARLREAERRLTLYERTHGVVSGNEAVAVQGAADLLARKLGLQVRRTWMESYSGRNSPALQAVSSELAAVDREIARLPGLKQEAGRLQLDVEIQRRVYTLLTAQFEEARLEEARSIPSVTVLDPARPPTIKARPRRGLIALVSAGVAALLATLWVLYAVRREAERAPRTAG